MREIKFRAWNTDMKRWYTVGQKNLYHSTIIPAEGEVIMQFTGLRDKNGKEIYEGDIALVNGGQTTNMGYPDAPHESIEWCGAVSFAGGCFFIEGQVGDWPYRDDLEVIGNIYESPELLEKAS